MIITGDIHGDLKFKHLSDYAASLGPSENSPQYLIIAGDFGGLWQPGDRSIMDACGRFPFATLFVDGNHENFDLLNSYPVTIWNGGKVHQITEKVIHLMRGQVFELEGKTVFTFGGAVSTDRQTRTPGLNWWPEELASEAELAEAEYNLRVHGNQVDYIIKEFHPEGIAKWGLDHTLIPCEGCDAIFKERKHQFETAKRHHADMGRQDRNFFLEHENIPDAEGFVIMRARAGDTLY